MSVDAGAARVVSLVPSLTEALAPSGLLVGATDWCTHPADLDQRGVARVRGTKNPDLAAVRALEPDVVLCVKEENRELDVRRLRESGVRVWVADIETVPQAVAAYDELYDEVLGLERPAWLEEARALWCGPPPPVTRRVVVPIWRDPWMVVGPRTFTADLLRRLGWEVVAAVSARSTTGDGPTTDARYPTLSAEQLDSLDADAVLLPDEPYIFTVEDGPEAFARTPVELVSGRLLTWYGPSLVEAHASLDR